MIRPYRSAVFLTVAALLLAQGIAELVVERDWTGYWAILVGGLSLAFFFGEVNHALRDSRRKGGRY